MINLKYTDEGLAPLYQIWFAQNSILVNYKNVWGKHRWNLLSKYHIGNVKALLYDADTDEVKRIIFQTENQEKCIGMIELAEQIEQQDTDLGAMIQNRTGNTGGRRFDGL